METPVNSGTSLSPGLAVAPQEQMWEAALAFAWRRTVGLGKKRLGLGKKEPFTFLPVEIPLLLKGTLAQSVPLHPHTAHLSGEEMDTDTKKVFRTVLPVCRNILNFHV